MAVKRTASNDLNHTNWDRDEEPEESGTFQKASVDTIKGRVIKTARRRNPAAAAAASPNTSESDKKNIFGAFSFTKTAANNNFNFLTNIKNKTEVLKTNSVDSETKQNETQSVFKILQNTKIMATNEKNDKSNEYYAKLKGLNESVSEWIKKHVDANPLINLQPIFRDYEKYLNELDTDEMEKNKNKDSNSNNINKLSAESSEKLQTTGSLFSFKQNDTSSKQPLITEPLEITESTKFKFGNVASSTGFSFKSASSNNSTNLNATSSTTTTSPFSFGNSAAPTTSGFKLGASTSKPSFNFDSGNKPFTFGNVAAPPPPAEEHKNENEDEEDQPPKVEFTPVVEEGNVYQTRCKVFVKKDGKFGDRGVGNLFLKPVQNSEKTQLIVRADTNLGNLLCNLILSKNIPLQRMGKKDVMLVCLPTPESKPPPTPMLLRVKSTEEADELLKVLQTHQK